MNWERWAAILAIALGLSNVGKNWFVNDYRIDAIEVLLKDRQAFLIHVDEKVNDINKDVAEIKGYLILKGWQPRKEP